MIHPSMYSEVTHKVELAHFGELHHKLEFLGNRNVYCCYHFLEIHQGFSVFKCH